jgi:hypothetical protein
MNVLVLNSGSSSQKSCLYEIGDTLPPIRQLAFGRGRSSGVMIRPNTRSGTPAELQRTRWYRRALVEKRLSACSRVCGAETRKRFPVLPKSMLWDIAWSTAVRHFEPAIVTERSRRRSKSFPFCAAPQSCRTARHGDCREIAGSGAAGRGFRHWFSPNYAAVGVHLSRSLRVVRAGNSPLRIPRDQSSVLRRAGCAIAGQRSEFSETRDLPPGQWLLPGGDSRRSKRGYDHGFYPA